MGYPLCSSQDSDPKNFLVSPLTGPGMKMDCGEQRLEWSDRAGRYPWKFSLLLRLIFHQACGTSWSSFSANYHLVGSLKQNTNGYGFVLRQVCLTFLLFGTSFDSICTLHVPDGAETKEGKGLQWVCW